MMDLEFEYNEEMGSRQSGEIQLCFPFFSVFLYFLCFDRRPEQTLLA